MFHKQQLSQKEKSVKSAVRQAARTELLLNEQVGYVTADGCLEITPTLLYISTFDVAHPDTKPGFSAFQANKIP